MTIKERNWEDTDTTIPWKIWRIFKSIIKLVVIFSPAIFGAYCIGIGGLLFYNATGMVDLLKGFIIVCGSAVFALIGTLFLTEMFG